MLAIGCGKENGVRIFRTGGGAEGSKKKEWAACEVLGGHGDLVHDVAWAPNVGRWVGSDRFRAFEWSRAH